MIGEVFEIELEGEILYVKEIISENNLCHGCVLQREGFNGEILCSVNSRRYYRTRKKKELPGCFRDTIFVQITKEEYDLFVQNKKK